MSTLGSRLAELRQKRGLTQEELASKIPVVKEQISRWENDKVAPEAKQIVPLADALGVTTDRILRDPDGLPPGLYEVVMRAEELFGEKLSDDIITWARDEVRSHGGDVESVEWVARINRKRRGNTPSDAQKTETVAFRTRASTLGVRSRSKAR